MNKSPKYDHLAIYKFKPGQSGNIQGRPKAYQTVLKELGFTKPVIATMIAEIMFMSAAEVRKLCDSDTEPVIRTIIANAFRKANGYGDFSYIEPYLKILFGRPIPYIPESVQNNRVSDNP